MYQRTTIMPHHEIDGEDNLRGMSKKEMRQVIRDLQGQQLAMEEDRNRLQKENEALKHTMNAQEDAANESDTELEQSGPSALEITRWKKYARAAGGRAGALFDPFLNHRVLADHQVQAHIRDILREVRQAKDGGDGLEDDDNAALYWDTVRFETPGPIALAREMMFNLPMSPNGLWLRDWFQDEIRAGIRKLRSIFVYDLARCYSNIFGFTNIGFKNRSERPNLPEVQALSDFMHMEAVDEEGHPDFTLFFKDQCIARSLRLLLLGESAILGKRSSKARDSHAKLWHVKYITPSLLAFVATAEVFPNTLTAGAAAELENAGVGSQAELADFLYQGASVELFGDDEDTSQLEDRQEFPPPLTSSHVWIRHHPASGQPNELLDLKSPTSSQPASVPSKSHSGRPTLENDNLPVFFPFSTLKDFQQAEIFADYGATDAHIDRQLALASTDITLKNAKGYHDTLALAIRLSGRTFTHYVHFQPVLPALAAVVGDPELAPFMKYYPEERWVARPDTTDGAMRVWEELWHSLLWWKFQDHILAHQCILYLVVYIDETSVSTIGGVHVWPIYLWVGNLPASIRKQRKGKGGAVLIGYLPKAQKDKGVRDMAGLRCQVYHNAIAKVFESLKIPSRYGTPLRCGDGIIREFVPVLAAGSADYMEFIRMVCILGHRSDFPCPTCLVPRLQQSKLSEKWPVRTVLETEDILQCALNEPQPSVKKTILQEQSLRSVRNAFNDIIPPFHSIYEAFVADPLHQIEQGVWGAHLWPWIRDQLDSNKKDVLDERFKAIPIYPDLKHFPNGVTALKYLTGKEHGVILKFIVPLIQDMILDKYRKIVLGSFRTLAVIHMLSKFTTHTDLSLEELERQILKFDKLHEKLHKKFDISANYPKLHSLSHLVTIIREHSTTDNYHTGLGEALHPQSKKDYRRTNHQPDFENQMLRMHQEREAIIHIRVQIDSAGAVSEEIEPELSELWDGPNVQFGAPDRHGRQLAGSFTHACRQQDTCYQKMPLHLRTFLYQRVGGFGNKTHFRESDLPHLDGMVVSIYA
ncbi:hypothetical protein V565_206070 [Rhizoctonia solani 123E]|uniref:Uncharacterized protein n=1 Tax=Rhizoctonia solani 123E TaxID=1423351 RepID=A0A074RNS4_9AGAM|nr:hypothetical protein V565_206070 [Rhizoctonia solani 123E]